MVMILRVLAMIPAVLAGALGAALIGPLLCALIALLSAGGAYAHQRRQLRKARSGSACTGCLCQRGDRVLAVRIAAASTAAVLALVGLVATIGAAALGLAALVAALYTLRTLMRAANRWQVPPKRGTGSAVPLAVTEQQTRPHHSISPLIPASPEHIRALPTDRLCRAWRLSFLLLASSHRLDDVDAVARCRSHYLDELERRDPAGFRRWLDDGARAASDPARYIAAGSERSETSRADDGPSEQQDEAA